MWKKANWQLNVNEFVLTKLDPECGLAQPQLVMSHLIRPDGLHQYDIR